MFRPNDQVGQYTLIRPLGAGSFGEVWLAEKRSQLTSIQVAIKFPHAFGEDGEDFAQTLERQRINIAKEADIWTKASGHPNILPLIDADIFDGHLAIVSEYAPDGSLSKWLYVNNGKAPSIEAAVEMLNGILSGLDHLHRRGIVHRDLKPANILLQGENPRLTDFGISRLLDATPTRSLVSGTFAYMPPEAFQGTRSERTDIWSAGVMLYQMLAGRLPYPEKDPFALMHAIQNYVPSPLPDYIPPALQWIVWRALERDESKRFQSAAEMRYALRQAAYAPQTPQPHPQPPKPDDELPTIPAGEQEKLRINWNNPPHNDPRGHQGQGLISPPPKPPDAQFQAQPIIIALGVIIVPVLLIIFIASANSKGCRTTTYNANNGNRANYNTNYNSNSKSNGNSSTNMNSGTGNMNSGGNTNSSATFYDIPEIDGKVMGIRLYEGGVESPKFGSRTYQEGFVSSNTRYIHVELNINYPSSTSARKFSIDIEWYRNGTQIKKDNSSGSNGEISAGWTGSYHVWWVGTSSYGNLSAGDYDVIFRSKGRVIANKKFTVTGSSSSSNMSNTSRPMNSNRSATNK